MSIASERDFQERVLRAGSRGRGPNESGRSL